MENKNITCELVAAAVPCRDGCYRCGETMQGTIVVKCAALPGFLREARPCVFNVSFPRPAYGKRDPATSTEMRLCRACLTQLQSAVNEALKS